MVSSDFFKVEYEVFFPSHRLFIKVETTGNPKLDRELASVELIEQMRRYISENIQAVVSQQEEETV